MLIVGMISLAGFIGAPIALIARRNASGHLIGSAFIWAGYIGKKSRNGLFAPKENVCLFVRSVMLTTGIADMGT